jgi:hypothetical protein
MAEKEEKVTRLHKILDRVIAKFSEAPESTETVLAESTMEDGTVIKYENTEVGTPVVVVTEEGEAPAPDGEYPISETTILVVAEGAIAEVKETPVEEAPAEEVEAEKGKNPMSFFNPDRFAELVDLTKEGFYTVQFSVSNGTISWGNLFSESFTELSEQKSGLEVKLAEKETEISALKAKFESDLKILGETIKASGLVQAPIEKSEPTILSKNDFVSRRLEDQRKEKSIYQN